MQMQEPLSNENTSCLHFDSEMYLFSLFLMVREEPSVIEVVDESLLSEGKSDFDLSATVSFHK